MTMYMKEHILAALKEQIERWETLLATMSTDQITSQPLPSEWSLKDEMAHLRAWQQRSIARFEAALSDRAPEFPAWIPGLDPDEEQGVHQVNDWIYQANREQPWQQVHREWRQVYLRLLELAQAIPEKDLLDGNRYPWLKGTTLAAILLGTYDHHQEHLDKLLSRLN
jgi:hypothetical protein